MREWLWLEHKMLTLSNFTSENVETCRNCVEKGGRMQEGVKNGKKKRVPCLSVASVAVASSSPSSSSSGHGIVGEVEPPNLLIRSTSEGVPSFQDTFRGNPWKGTCSNMESLQYILIYHKSKWKSILQNTTSQYQ